MSTETAKAKKRAWYHANKEELNRVRRAKTTETSKAERRVWYHANKEKLNRVRRSIFWRRKTARIFEKLSPLKKSLDEAKLKNGGGCELAILGDQLSSDQRADEVVLLPPPRAV